MIDQGGMTPIKRCPRCGKLHPYSAATCDGCGRQFRTTAPPQDVTQFAPPAAPAPLPVAPYASHPQIVGQSEAQHFAIVEECSRQFLGLTWHYVTAVLVAPTIFLTVAFIIGLRLYEDSLCNKIAALGLDATVWAAPLRRKRRRDILLFSGILTTGLVVIFLGIGLTLGWHGGPNTNESASAMFSELRVGMAGSDVLGKFGDPDKTQDFSGDGSCWYYDRDDGDLQVHVVNGYVEDFNRY